ncbi:M23 family metallopeptidase [Phytomonospora endophytica]|uniref:Murein DD-endopeptidase MepM/ murein hydrolase activator NlpD n=1 Tax=Phytomonospora endophytica TaxID=714109 RepID=A0A841FY56_9ACTN|nr:M23 family metallopeptidase [Phytomonospora endophytica]MBB6039663.1 murein DD-endopeptidase MepM/ murein hydrolase activator NlpD [Phytomonospora endophytica]
MRHRWFTGATATVAIGLLLLTAGSAHADPADDKARVDRELAKAEAALEGATERAQEAVKALAEVKGRLPGAKDALAEAEGILAAARIAAEAATEKAEAAQVVYEKASDKMAAADQAVDDAQETVGDSVSAAYQGLGVVAFSSVLNARSPGEVVDRLTYVDKLADSQDEALDEVLKAGLVAKERQNETLVAKQEADDAREAAEDAVAAAETRAAEAEAYQAALSELYRTRDAAAAVAEEERDESLARYDRLEEESERIERMLQAAASSNNGNGNGSGSGDNGNDDGPPPSSHGARLSMPVSGWKSSDFGMRYDPYYNVWQLHAGMDLAAGGGAPIRAAAGGRVVQAGWNGGYGNYTCIYHGKGISTCYAHQSSIGVWVGQHVKRGEYIGSVGTTGASTGNHLHFEVRVNGSPVNPDGWLPGCLCLTAVPRYPIAGDRRFG